MWNLKNTTYVNNTKKKKQTQGNVAIQRCLHAQTLCHLTLCDPMEYSLPGSSVHGISQAKILEWVTISFSRESSRSRD